MPRKLPVTFAESAVSDLQNIQDYYENEQAPETGRRLIADIIRAVQQLSAFPLSGRVVPEFDVSDLREIVHPPFRLVYRYDRKRVRIIRVWRSERLLKLP
ncbi:MAG TPA: type II toxin-antitoxin system RelE/ParE family toxin [Dissulfurispiraceae bacterium]|nr:type II toxin-antitoxin system RelE/ParE family toxin [Dissulfurispiraceae bacterium]